jgi:hypothetical protein
MTFENFVAAWQAFLARKPFLPCVVQLMTGDTIRVVHPEALVLRRAPLGPQARQGVRRRPGALRQRAR